MTGLIGLDWGTSSLRAYRFDDAGRVVDHRARAWGIRQLPAGGYPAALAEVTAGWPSLPRIACGMVGSRGGWHEVPYRDVPLALDQLGSVLVAVVAADGLPLWLVPGLRDAAGPDVMRGEETQLLGALHQRPALASQATCVMPGTHSKWVRIARGQIVAFRTVMTGEVFAALSRHTILGTTGAEPVTDAAAFDRGVIAARASGAAGAFSRLFTARALLLAGELAASAVPDYLSGLLIGEEFRSAVANGDATRDTPLQLIGDPDLCRRYAQAARHFDLSLSATIVDSAASGLWRLATLAGLVTEATSA
ncbi:MAG: 2-dehydro-3-deoxygalactonokinase [Rhodanobacter sp.]|nr:MAG: 2-dehydro-3-deoxygalactonokinase [Rhodanobacter sp.]TAM11467.1 MAG: 2-dehydro-3-deoxygalactonokinase [Rhodanobacter sp.]TAM37047.1 MAG: 2-dehydro-3-deoxygalactonokinase [Rhodanobacter sp.]